MENLPNDADGDALRKLIELGHDLSRPMVIDFFIAVPSEQAGLAVAEAAEEHGYMVAVEYDDEDREWTCYCSCEMVPTLPGLIAAQSKLQEIAIPYGGYTDGWGTSGNAETGGE
jgi:hypothetical protein